MLKLLSERTHGASDAILPHQEKSPRQFKYIRSSPVYNSRMAIP